MRKRFSARALAELEMTKYLRIRPGDHRFIPIWVVTVESRVIVRSWNDNPGGWYRAFVANPLGHIWLEGYEMAVRAVRLRSKRLNDAADDAYAAKYPTKANEKYVTGFKAPNRKATTLELLPA